MFPTIFSILLLVLIFSFVSILFWDNMRNIQCACAPSNILDPLLENGQKVISQHIMPQFFAKANDPWCSNTVFVPCGVQTLELHSLRSSWKDQHGCMGIKATYTAIYYKKDKIPGTWNAKRGF
jgi:hypothetical protein